MNSNWPLSRELLIAILSDRVSDRFVCSLIWERLGYEQSKDLEKTFYAGPHTPLYWSERFLEAPEIIAKRQASVHLTRSIPKEYKQSLKMHLNFEGYRIGELFPRRTRRATAVNWLLAWVLSGEENLPDQGPLPLISETPVNPLKGHFGDPDIE